MGILERQIAKAERRAQGLDLGQWIEQVRDLTPKELASDSQKHDRLGFLTESLQDAEAAQGVFERIILGNDLQDVKFLPRGEIAARSVCRIPDDVMDASGRQKGWASGFLIAPQVLLTNHHVFSQAQDTQQSIAQF
jgi:endonuclease G, mitochondrial